MKQNVIEWFVRNKFNYWRILNSKGKAVADNSPNKESSAKDENGGRLGIELDGLERLQLSERYNVEAIQKNGQDWQTHPFITYGANQVNPSGGFPIEMAVMLGRMQAEQTSQQMIWQLQKEKEERERKEQETSGISDIFKMVKPLAPALIASVAPVAIKGIFDLADKSPQIRTFLERVASNPTVQEGIMQMLTNYFTTQTQANGTGVEETND